jgi:nitrogen regulatory protein PII
MKQIKAYIKPHKLDDVTRSLQKEKRLRGMSVVEVKGFGRRDEDDSHQPVDDLKDFARYSKIEIFCPEDLVEELVSIIEKNAYTGLRGDGKIYVLDVERAYKIGKGKID